MDTAQEIQMERKDLHHNGSKPSLHQSLQLSFTPPFLSHGWEYSLSPQFEYPNTHMETPGDSVVRLGKNPFTHLLAPLATLVSLFL